MPPTESLDGFHDIAVCGDGSVGDAAWTIIRPTVDESTYRWGRRYNFALAYECNGSIEGAGDWPSIVGECLAEWKTASGNRISFDLESENSDLRIEFSNADLGPFNEEKFNLAATTYPKTDTSVVKVVFNSNATIRWGATFDFRRVALHEIGHALGVIHTGSGTMAVKYRNLATRVDKYCREALDKKYLGHE